MAFFVASSAFIAKPATLVEDETTRLRQGSKAVEFIRGRYQAAAITEKYLYQYRRLLVFLLLH